MKKPIEQIKRELRERPAMGINVKSDTKAGRRYADLIVDGHKTYESRNGDTLRPYVGKRVAIVRTGEGPAKAIGEVTIGEPMVVNKNKFHSMESHHMVPQGSQFDISTNTKHLYPMHNPTRYETEQDVGHGIIARKVIHKAGGGPVLPIGPPADIAAKLAALKEQMRQQGTDFNRRMQGVVNAEKTAGTGVTLPTDKAKGGKIEVRPTVFDDAASRRNPNIESAAQALAEGKITKATYGKIVAKEKPVKPYDFIPKPATEEDALRAIGEKKMDKWKAHESWPAGRRVGLRLDIPSYERHGVWMNTVHDEEGSGEHKLPTSHGPVSSVRNATFEGSPDKAIRVATGEMNKNSFAKIKGELEHIDEDQAVKHFQKYLNHPDYVQVGYDPRRHGDFYDRKTMKPVTHSEHVVQIGPLVLAKKPVYGKRSLYSHGGVAHLAIGGQGPKNWMKGVEDVINPLKQKLISGTDPAEALKQMQEQYSSEKMQNLPEDVRGSVNRSFESLHRMNAMNQWVERNLSNYIRKQMATPDDPIRKLAEEGIVHVPFEHIGMRYGADRHRATHGGEQLAQSNAAKTWEDASDMALGKTTVGDVLRLGQNEGMKKHVEPWMEKADPKTELFHPTDSMQAHYLGFDHLVDILKQDLAEGRIRPDQLHKVSIEHAVRRAHEYDQERKKAMAETALKATEGMPVHKEYPEGYKWIELAMNPELPEGHSMTPAGTYVDPQGNESIHHPNYAKLDDALKYEGDTMGHCVGGYTPDVVAGKSRIFSLRDAKNEPHVTVEVEPSHPLEGYKNLNEEQKKELHKQVVAEHFGGQEPDIKSAFGNLANYDKHPYFKRLGESYVNKYGMPAPSIVQIKGKGNAKPKKDYIPYVQDFVKSGNWSHVDDLHNTDLLDVKHMTNPTTHQKYVEQGLNVPKYATEDELDALHNEYLKTAEPHNYKPPQPVRKAEGGSMNTPDLAQSRLSISQRANPALMDNIGINEALDMSPKTFINPEPSSDGALPVGGVDKIGGLPIGGVDQSADPGMQLMPQQLQQPEQDQQGGLPQVGGQPPSAGASSPAQQQPSNILSLTPQGRAFGAMAPQGMAKGGSAKEKAQARFDMEKRMAHLADGGQPPEDEPYENTSKRKRILFRGSGYGEVKGIIVPRHMWHGGKEKDGKRVLGMKDLNEARAQVYGPENRDPMAISSVEKLHRNVLQSHFAKPIDDQLAAEEAALNKLRLAKHIGHGSNTLDKSVKLDTVNHEHDEQGRTYKGFASKGVAGSSLYTSGHGENRKFHIINTCPGQTSDCGGGYDKNGIADSLNGSCFAPKSEAQYVAASVRRAAHEQAKHDPAMTSDWILAHTGSLRDAADTADRQNKRILFRPNVVDETDRSSRLAIGHLNRQRAASKKPPITSNQYGKTTELHDPANGIHVTHSNTGPKVKDGATVEGNVARDKMRIRETHLASDASGRDYTNEQGKKTPTKGSYFVTGVKRHSPLSKEMEKHITHAKYWTTGRHFPELTKEERQEPEEAHYGPNGDPTTEDKAHYGHTTLNDKRYDYQKQHILHPRLVNVPERKKNKITGEMETVEHMIPTDSRFKDVDYLPPTPFMSKNGKVAGHILMTTPTESTTNEEHLNGFMHPVDFADIEHAKQNNGEYVVDAPEKQEAARGKIFVAPKEVKITKMKKRKKFALGGIVDGDEEQDHDLNDDDFYAFPERNSAAQRHLARRRSTIDADELHHVQLYRHEA